MPRRKEFRYYSVGAVAAERERARRREGAGDRGREKERATRS